MWSKPQLQDQAFEVVEARIDKAEKNIAEALDSEDSRRRDAASFFVLRNSARAKRRGWIMSASAGVDVNVGADLPPRRIIISWQSPDDKEDDANDKLEDGGKLIEHEAKPVFGHGLKKPCDSLIKRATPRDRSSTSAGHACRAASHRPPAMPAVSAGYARGGCWPSNHRIRFVQRH